MSFALPDYLTRNNRFDDCPPGHRFGLYFDGWEADWRKPSNKTPAFITVAGALPSHSRAALKALCQRQSVLAASLGDLVFTHPARLTAPLATGLGNEHPLENGFAFLNPHGLPYLAGSGVKGVIRRAAEELASGDWGDTAGWDQHAIDVLFGLETEPGDTNAIRTRGALMFWDLFFQPARDKVPLLTVEIMTPHHSGYLQGNGSPHANEQPNPIPFLAVAAGCECTLHVQCNPALIPAEAAALRERWRALLAAAIELAGEWLGFGAKSAVGYGRLAQDPARRRKLEQEAAARAEAQAQQARQAESAALSPQARAIAKFVEQCSKKQASGRKDPLNPGSGLYAVALQLSRQALDEAQGWSAADRLQLAEALAQWLPAVVEKLDRKDDWKDARKKLHMAALRGESA
ncbi:type III-B CRISPR module RAMP protein Cmr6 [Pseudothauera hydrothermalis]|uniref:type III-B CRISPR module RAMP protein Cmr6 n=1 Tax=Pseudothauera hydrothermalis TaxID=2184083 RepID=UPI000E099138|nr:type III-B CRISPR module RAMP protein Cmr6 [Pseudothauera hydrothermalis]